MTTSTPIAGAFCCSLDDPMDCAERTVCPVVGGVGHSSCGECAVHGEPRHRCGCYVFSADWELTYVEPAQELTPMTLATLKGILGQS